MVAKLGKRGFVIPAQRCPSCGAERFTVRGEIRKIPHFGETLLTLASCSSCGFRHSDVMSLVERKPTRYEFEISSSDDMKVRVIKSSTGIIKIPSLGVTIKPGPAGEGFISNIEGVLKRVERAIKLAMQNATEEQIKRGSSRLEKLQKVLNGQLRAKIIVIDPSGNSAIIDERAKKQELRS